MDQPISLKRKVLYSGAGALAVLAFWGVFILVGLFAGWWRLIPWAVIALFVGLRVAAEVTGNDALALGSRLTGAFLLPILALLSVDAAWAHFTDWRPWPPLGILFAAIVVGATIWISFETWWTAKEAARPVFWAVFYAGTLLVAPPIIVWALTKMFHDQGLAVKIAIAVVIAVIAAAVIVATKVAGEYRLGEAIAAAVAAVTLALVVAGLVWSGGAKPPDPDAVAKLDIVTIVGGPESVGQAAPSSGWSVRYWNGRVGPDGAVKWDAPGPPQLRKDADSALVLLPDGAPETPDRDGLANAGARPGEVARWTAIARGAGVSADTPAYVLLQSRDEARLKPWRDEFEKTAKPRVLPLQDQAGSLGDRSFQLASTSPTADSDLSLALRHRPALFFASGETDTLPLNADRLIESGVMGICPDNPFGIEICKKVTSPDDLVDGANRLSFNTKQLANATNDTTIYVHVTSTRPRDYVYLDYWWYLPDNPALAGDGALCGAGFVIAGITCHDHPSDWEGVTVIVKVTGNGQSTPVAVHYSAHTGRTRYLWGDLQKKWANLVPPGERRFESNVDTTVRPLVFVALGTHAGYPDICRTAQCDEHTTFADHRHDGTQPWVGNVDNAPQCKPACVAALPTTDRGRKQASWNAYHGPWGGAHCFLVYCNKTESPRAPGQQDRYKRPWCATRAATLNPRTGTFSTSEDTDRRTGKRKDVCYPAGS